jgi:putative ABC transport system ATP-binding protein
MGVADIFSRASRREGTAVVMVTHDERLLEECDRVLTIQDGHLEESTAERASQHA